MEDTETKDTETKDAAQAAPADAPATLQARLRAELSWSELALEAAKRLDELEGAK